jgi:hypothetical protein
MNRQVTLPIEFEQCLKTGRIDAWKLEWKPGDPNPPHIFWDSDVGKWIEAAAYSLTTHADPDLEARIDRVVDMMAAAQMADGYLNTHYIAVEPEKRWTNLRDCHELYCAGHLMEAAVAYYEATGKRKMLDVLCRYADHIASVFGPGEGQKRGYCGHPEVELALVKLYHATSERRYLELAKYFIDQRGREPHYYDREARARGEDPAQYWAKTYEYCQAHKPLREQDQVVGHAVRAMYLYSGATDVAAETGDDPLLTACKRLWENVTKRRMYITGGLGPTFSNEGFTFDYDLPNETAYAETCASIAFVFWAHRMLQVEGDGQYADEMERALYNGVLSGVSLDGSHFFYANPLAVYPPAFANRRPEMGAVRQEWFDCACCPPNIARLLASLGAYMYSTSQEGIYVHLYAQGSAEAFIDGRRVQIEQVTEYPWAETVSLTLNPETPARLTLALRIPGWCREATMRVNGQDQPLAPVTRLGYACIERMWQVGDRVTLHLAMPVEQVEANPEVRMDCGRVVLQRGPMIYCLEEVDNGQRLSDITLPEEKQFELVKVPNLGEAYVLVAKAYRRDMQAWENTLYRPGKSVKNAIPIKAIPYFLWGNRAPGEMQVWLRGR